MSEESPPPKRKRRMISSEVEEDDDADEINHSEHDVSEPEINKGSDSERDDGSDVEEKGDNVKTIVVEVDKDEDVVDDEVESKKKVELESDKEDDDSDSKDNSDNEEEDSSEMENQQKQPSPKKSDAESEEEAADDTPLVDGDGGEDPVVESQTQLFISSEMKESCLDSLTTPDDSETVPSPDSIKMEEDDNKVKKRPRRRKKRGLLFTKRRKSAAPINDVIDAMADDVISQTANDVINQVELELEQQEKAAAVHNKNESFAQIENLIAVKTTPQPQGKEPPRQKRKYTRRKPKEPPQPAPDSDSNKLQTTPTKTENVNPAADESTNTILSPAAVDVALSPLSTPESGRRKRIRSKKAMAAMTPRLKAKLTALPASAPLPEPSNPAATGGDPVDVLMMSPDSEYASQSEFLEKQQSEIFSNLNDAGQLESTDAAAAPSSCVEVKSSTPAVVENLVQISNMPSPATAADAADGTPPTTGKKKRRRRTKAEMIEFRRMQFQEQNQKSPAAAAGSNVISPPLPSTPLTPLPMMPATPEQHSSASASSSSTVAPSGSGQFGSMPHEFETPSPVK